MRITFEYNDDELHLVKWVLFRAVSVLGCNDGDKDPIKYQHKRSISNVLDIPIQFKDVIMKEILKKEVERE